MNTPELMFSIFGGLGWESEGADAMSKPDVDTSIQAVEMAILPIKKLNPKIHSILLSRARKGYFATHQSAGSIGNLASELLDELSPDKEQDDHS